MSAQLGPIETGPAVQWKHLIPCIEILPGIVIADCRTLCGAEIRESVPESARPCPDCLRVAKAKGIPVPEV